jgi:F420-0:gamma-glutamyl ligase
MGELTEEQALHITEQAEARALEAEAAAAAERRRQKEQERIEAATREAERLEAEAKARTESANGADGRAGGADRDNAGETGGEAAGLKSAG